MSRRSVSLEGKHDQMVMFTLVELMTHLIFLALILGFALRKEADVKYENAVAGTRALVAKCGRDGAKCSVIRTGRKPGGEGLANCLGTGGKLLDARALAGGGFSVSPGPGLTEAVRRNPAIAPLTMNQTLTRTEFGQLAGAARRAANTGKLGQGACNFSIDLCRVHGNAGQFESQWNFASQYFYVPGPRACR